jgi:hypothetical protein
VAILYYRETGSKFEGDGWLSCLGDGWLSWVAKFVARLLATAALWVRTRHLSKIKNRRPKQKSGQHTLARQKNYLLYTGRRKRKVGT